jgi:hypothetical protein
MKINSEEEYYAWLQTPEGKAFVPNPIIKKFVQESYNVIFEQEIKKLAL